MTPVDSAMKGWCIDLSARVLGKRIGADKDGSELLSPAYELSGGRPAVDQRGNVSITPIVALPPVGLPGAMALRVYGGALLDCAELDADDRALLVQLVNQAEQIREAMKQARGAQRSGIVVAPADAKVNGRLIQ